MNAQLTSASRGGATAYDEAHLQTLQVRFVDPSSAVYMSQRAADPAESECRCAGAEGAGREGDRTYRERCRATRIPISTECVDPSGAVQQCGCWYASHAGFSHQRAHALLPQMLSLTRARLCTGG